MANGLSKGGHSHCGGASCDPSTEAEIFYGIELFANGRRRNELLGAADAMFDEDPSGRIFSFESYSARVFSKSSAQRRALGRPISPADGQIAAIAQVRRAKLATRNVTGNLAEAIRRCFAELGGLEFELPRRDAVRKAPNFPEWSLFQH
jgi:predicted nucleic acid-binding protein